MRLLGEYDNHPIGILRGTSDPVIGYLSAAFRP